MPLEGFSEWLSAFALIVSIFSVGLTFYRTAASTLLHREQMAAMRIVASRTVLLWDQVQTVARVQLDGLALDSYRLISFQKTALRLEDALDKATGVGLFPRILGDHRHSLMLYAAFVQGLSWVANLEEADEQPLETSPGKHFSMGLVRLLDVCQKFDSSLLPENLFESMDTERLEELVKEAWTYMDRPSPHDS